MGKVLHASYSGWFPTCIQTELPPITDLEERYSGEAESLGLMMSIYWRVREWELQFSSATQDPEVNVTATGIYGFDAEKEEDLVCAPSFVEKSFTTDFPSFQEHGFTLLSVLFADLYYAITSLDGNSTFRFAYNLLYYALDDGSAGGFAPIGAATNGGDRHQWHFGNRAAVRSPGSSPDRSSCLR